MINKVRPAAVCLGFALIAACNLRQLTTASPNDSYAGKRLGIEKVGIVWSPARVTWDATLIQARDFVAQRREDSGISELIIGPSTSEFRLSTRGHGRAFLEEDVGIDKTVAVIRREGLPKSAIARVFKIGSRAVFSYREASPGRREQSAVREQLLSGSSDPTRFDLKGRRYRLLYLADQDGRGDRYQTLGVYVRAYDEPTCADCELLRQQIAMYTTTRNVEVRIASEPWFDGPFFPVVFRFDPDSPSFGNIHSGFDMSVTHYYRGGREVECELAGQNPRCTPWNLGNRH